MFFQKKHDTGDNMHEINMTPLIDVSLVLVVMLLLATPLAFESSITVRRSESHTNKVENKIEEPIRVKIVSDDQIQINRKLVRRENLGAALQPLIKASKKRQVTIDCADGVSHGTFVSVLDAAKMCGASDIAVMGK